MSQHDASLARVQVSAQVSSELADTLYRFLRPLLFELPTQLDRRPVHTVLSTVTGNRALAAALWFAQCSSTYPKDMGNPTGETFVGSPPALGCPTEGGVLALPVYELATDRPLWLVVARPGQGREPWYLLTMEPVDSGEAAWRTVLAYACRWQVEMAIRFDKSERGFDSIRVRDGEAPHKLLLLASLA